LKRVAIYGASGHGKVVADIARLHHYEVIILDDGDNEYLSYESFKREYKDVSIAFGIGDNVTRKILFNKVIEDGIKIETLIHPSAIIASSSNIGLGSVVMAGCVVNADSNVGIGVILNSSCIVEHDNKISDFVHISPGVSLAGNVHIDTLTHIGIGSTAIQGIQVGEGVVIGAHSLLIKDIPAHVMAYGSPAKVVKEMK
jgi:UDP-N-acetylbacillosamine N-acetyltransferase